MCTHRPYVPLMASLCKVPFVGMVALMESVTDHEWYFAISCDGLFAGDRIVVVICGWSDSGCLWQYKIDGS